MKTTICVTVHTGDLFDGYQGDDFSSIDVEASEIKYAEVAEAKLNAALGDDYEIICDFPNGAGFDKITAIADVEERPWEIEEIARDAARGVLETVFQDGEWFVYKS